jgi:hypothetical protein
MPLVPGLGTRQRHLLPAPQQLLVAPALLVFFKYQKT